MTVCTDVYTRPQSCDSIFIYPSQVHPGGRVRPSGPLIRKVKPKHPRDIPVQLEDEDAEIALVLLELL